MQSKTRFLAQSDQEARKDTNRIEVRRCELLVRGMDNSRRPPAGI